MARKAKAVDFLINRMSKMRIKDEAALLSSAATAQEDVQEASTHQPFRFFGLPYELRLRVYEFLLLFPKTIDLDPTNQRIIAPNLRLFLVDRRMHDEASRVFYSQNTFRVFPVHGRYINKKHPLFAWLPRKYRAHITLLELRIGPGFTRPPKGWVVDKRLGLAAATRLRKLKVFIEIDPSSTEIFESFKTVRDSFFAHCVGLLRGLLAQAPSINEVEFDAYPSVTKSSPLLNTLLHEVRLNQKRITWGPERGWDQIVEADSANLYAESGS